MRRRLDFRDMHQHRHRSGSKSKSPGARTGTSMRGSSKTHTLRMELERAMNCLNHVKVDPKATSYKRLYNDLRECQKRSNQHLNHDDSKDLDLSYTEDLAELVDRAEDFLNSIDERGDEVEAAREKQRRLKEQISKCLPRTQPQKWDGTINDFMRFKAGAKTLIDNIPDRQLALNAILDTISDPKLQKVLSKYQTPEEALKSLELQFGNPELSGPKIVNDLKCLPRATSTEGESALILKIKEHYTSLTEIKQQHLLGKNELLNLCHKFEREQGRVLLRTLLSITGDEALQMEEMRKVFFEKLDELYTENTIWSRTNLEKDRRPEEPRGEQRDGIKKPNIYTNTRRSATATEHVEERVCKICKGDHFNHQCDEVEKMVLNQVAELGLCPHCLWDKHDNECPHIKKATFICKHCNLHYKLKKLHIQCSSWNDTTQTN